MLELPLNITIHDCQRNQRVPATIVELTVGLAHEHIDGRWWIGVDSQRRYAEMDGRWSWSDLVAECRYNPLRECFAVQLSDGSMGAAARVALDACSVLQPGSGAVLLDRIATAPCNRDWLNPEPRSRGCGEGLVRLVVARSYELGLGGRTVLYCAGSEGFYEDLGFVATSEASDDMILYELPEERAQVLVEEFSGD